MRFRICVFVLTSSLLVGSAFGQDLNQLKASVSKLWDARIRQKRTEALQLVERQTQDLFLNLNEAPISSFKILGIGFTDDPTRVEVSVKVHGLIARVGEMDRTTQETWVWKDGQWLMHALPPPTMFDSDTEKRPSAPPRPTFQLTETVIDAGRHAQGETIEGKIHFKAQRSEIRVIRPTEKIPGLIIGSPVWTGPSTGYLSYRWETILLSQSVNQKIALEAVATSDASASVDVQFRARIDGKVGFKQIPEIIDPAKDGQVELQLQNLSTTKALKILSVMSSNSAYVVDDNVQESIEPGKSARLLIRYTSQTPVMGASIALVLSESLTPSGITAVPLNVKIPEEKRPGYAQEDIKPLLPPIQPTLPPR